MSVVLVPGQFPGVPHPQGGLASTMLSVAVASAVDSGRLSRAKQYFNDGSVQRIELDTGLLERSLRGPALGRKNYLFFGSLAGGRTAATLYSVVQSARLYHLDVTAYLTDVLRRLPAIEPRDQSAHPPGDRGQDLGRRGEVDRQTVPLL